MGDDGASVGVCILGVGFYHGIFKIIKTVRAELVEAWRFLC